MSLLTQWRYFTALHTLGWMVRFLMAVLKRVWRAYSQIWAVY